MTATIWRSRGADPVPTGSTDGSAGDPPRVARRKLPILVGAALVVVLVAVWVVAFSPLLGVRTVIVTGTQTLSADTVRSAAGIGHGAPLIRLDTAAVRHRVEALPDVAQARVDIAYPSTVRIAVTERVPVGYLTHGAGYVLVDKSGAQYREVATAPADLPRFALPSDASARASGEAAAIVAGALDASIRSLLAQVTATAPNSITLVLRDGRIVAWGSADRSEQKAQLLPALLTQAGTRYDVSNPGLVVVR